jgi:oxalate decarboxylase
MSDFQRRDFLTGAAAMAAAFAATRPAEAGDPSFMNNVPDEILSGPELPTFKFELEKSEGKVIGGNSGKEATVKQLPISKGLAGVSMKLEPGAMRELHWHPNADEWQYVIDGDLSVTMFGSHGRYRTETLAKGDVAYIPQGYGHSIENVGTKPSRMLIGFNTGNYEAINLSQWIAGNPVDVLATNFSKPAALFEKFPRAEVFIADQDGHGPPK